MIKYFRNSDPPIVRVTSDDGTVKDFALADFEADPEGSVASTGNGIAPKVIVPVSVSASHARIAMSMTPSFVNPAPATVLDDVNAMISQLPVNDSTRIAWEYEHNFERNSQAINTLGGALSLDAAVLDALFIQADAINA